MNDEQKAEEWNIRWNSHTDKQLLILYKSLMKSLNSTIYEIECLERYINKNRKNVTFEVI